MGLGSLALLWRSVCKLVLDYRFWGPTAQYRAKSIVSSSEAGQQTFQSCVEAGVDEAIAWPCIADLDQIDRLAEAVGRFAT
jgi:hypothetical protein